MLFKQLHWLEITEYLAVAIAIVALPFALASNSPGLILIVVSIALGLNLITRLRDRYSSRKRLKAAIEQLHRQIFEELPTFKSENRPTYSPQIDSDSLKVLQANLVSLERSIDDIAHYLKSHALPDKIEALESTYAQLKQQILDSGPEISPLLPQTPAEESQTFDLTEVSSPSPKAFTWRCTHTLDAHAEVVSSLAISPNNRLLASASWDRDVKLWDFEAASLIARPVGHSQGILAVIFGDRDLLATGSFDRAIKIWSLVPESDNRYYLRLERSLKDYSGSIHALAYAPASHILVGGSYDRTIKQWQPKSGELLATSIDDSGAIYAIALHEPTRLIASAGGDGRVSLWELETGAELGWLTGNVSSVQALAISTDGQTIAAGCVDGSIKLWSLESFSHTVKSSPQPIRVVNASAGQIKSLLFSADGQYLLSGSTDGAIAIWHSSSTQPIDVLSLSNENSDRVTAVCSLALSNDGRLLASGSTDGKIRIWQR
jgi:COMPASS component SWD3